MDRQIDGEREREGGKLAYGIVCDLYCMSGQKFEFLLIILYINRLCLNPTTQKTNFFCTLTPVVNEQNMNPCYNNNDNNNKDISISVVDVSVMFTEEFMYSD